jgi:hypothetical protein
MNVLMISPGYPAGMAFFTRGLATAGASVIGVGDQPPPAVPAIARDALAHYIHVGSLAAEEAVAATVREPVKCASTGWSACGSPIWFSPRDSARSLICPG